MSNIIQNMGCNHEISRKIIAQNVKDIMFVPLNTDIEVVKKNATSFSLAELGSLGLMFNELASPLVGIASTFSGGANTLLVAKDVSGNLVDVSSLSRFSDNSGAMLGSRIVNGSTEQVRLHAVSNSGMPAASAFNPALLVVSAVLIDMNKKMSAIQEIQDKIFEYIKQRDKAESRANLEILSGIFEQLSFNWNNDTFCTNKHIQVQQIKQESEKGVILNRAQVESAFSNQKMFHFDHDTRKQISYAVEALEEYRISLYNFAFSSFLEIVLLANWNAQYLDSVIRKINELDSRYIELYNNCKDAIECRSDTSVDHHAKKGISFVADKAAQFTSSKKIKPAKLINKGLGIAGEILNKNIEETINELSSSLLDLESTDISPFINHISLINQLSNKRNFVLLDKERVYLMSA